MLSDAVSGLWSGAVSLHEQAVTRERGQRPRPRQAPISGTPSPLEEAAPGRSWGLLVPFATSRHVLLFRARCLPIKSRLCSIFSHFSSAAQAPISPRLVLPFLDPASPSAFLLSSVARFFHEVSVTCHFPESCVLSVRLRLDPSAAFSLPMTLLEASARLAPSADPPRFSSCTVASSPALFLLLVH